MRLHQFLVSFAPAAALLAGWLAACATLPLRPTTWTAASADPAVVNVTRASFAPGSRVTDAVLTECNLERVIPEYIARWAPVPVVLADDASGGARVLTLEVRDIWAPRGGAWSGPKSLSLHGELLERRGDGWVLVGSFDARRTTVRGIGTCEMLYIVVDAIAKDVRAWMSAPSLNAPLGEL